MSTQSIPNAARFWSKVNKDGPIPVQCPERGPCWEWMAGCFANGYGAFAIARKNTHAHRVAWEILCGPIPDGQSALHHCDNPRCQHVDPDPVKSHIFLGTQLENMRDKVAKGRQAQGDANGARLHPDRLARGKRNGKYTKPESVPHGEQVGTAKLTEEEVQSIRRLIRDGMSQRAIARRFGIAQTTVSAIARRIIWPHIP